MFYLPTTSGFDEGRGTVQTGKNGNSLCGVIQQGPQFLQRRLHGAGGVNVFAPLARERGRTRSPLHDECVVAIWVQPLRARATSRI